MILTRLSFRRQVKPDYFDELGENCDLVSSTSPSGEELLADFVRICFARDQAVLGELVLSRSPRSRAPTDPSLVRSSTGGWWGTGSRGGRISTLLLGLQFDEDFDHDGGPRFVSPSSLRSFPSLISLPFDGLRTASLPSPR